MGWWGMAWSSGGSVPRMRVCGSLFLTPQGQSMHEEICTSIEQAHLRLLAGFSPAEATLLKDWLQRIVANAGGGDDYSCA